MRHQTLAGGVAWALSEALSAWIDGLDLSLTLAIVSAHPMTLRERHQLLRQLPVILVDVFGCTTGIIRSGCPLASKLVLLILSISL